MLHLLSVLLVVLQVAHAGPAIRGTVVDPESRPVENARVSLSDAQNVSTRTTQTDNTGRFQFSDIAAGNYALSVEVPGFSTQSRAVQQPAEGAAEVRIELKLAALSEAVTVTAERGLIGDVQLSPQQVSVVNESDIRKAATSVLAQVASEAVGAALQRTSPTIGGIYIRGLTGKNVVVYVDGVRFTTSAQRGGINTFLNLNESAELNRVEILRGPSSSQYGSDSLAGSVQLLSYSPVIAASGREWHGQFGTSFSSATMGSGVNARGSYGTERFGLTSTLASRRDNTVRSGGGFDTHAAVTRFLGLPSTVFGERLPDTAFTQYGGSLRFNYLINPSNQLTVSYHRNQQDGGKRYDQLLGGDGNNIADLRNLMGDFLMARLDTGSLRVFDTTSAVFSFNRQREERVNQGGNGNPAGGITAQYERLNAFGGQWHGNRTVRSRYNVHIGAELYREQLAAPSYTLSPVSGIAASARPRIPDGARYLNGGAYTRHSVDAIPKRLRISGIVRFNGASYRARASSLWPADSDRFSDASGSVGAVATIAPPLRVHFNYGRGFRAPNMTDLGTLGLTGDGFEVAHADIAALGGTIGTTADEAARSLGKPVARLKSEHMDNFDTGIHLGIRRWRFDVTGFVIQLDDAIVKQALILPPGATGSVFLGGQPIIRQTPAGAVFVSVVSTPVIVRTNLDRTRHYGIEAESGIQFNGRWATRANLTWVRAYDAANGRAPNIEGGTPAARGLLSIQYQPQRRLAIELSSTLVARQTRFSSLDVADRRGLATRSRGAIANFFTRGATVRGLVRNGVLVQTGETLAQVQDRVLGPGVNSAPLITHLPGYVLFNVRATYRLSDAQEIAVATENLTDRNYRGVSWGMPGPGFDLLVRYGLRF